LILTLLKITSEKLGKAREKFQEKIRPEFLSENRIQAKRPNTSENKRNLERVGPGKEFW